MKERAKFVLKVAEGELSIAAACREFGISRTCGYKWLRRYHEEGIAALGDRSRKPLRCEHEVIGAPEGCSLRGRSTGKNKTHFLSKAFADKTVAFEIVSSKKINIWFREWCIAYTSPDFSAPLVEYNLLTLSPDMRRKMRA